MKTINEIRDVLCEEIDRIRAGKTTPANVNAVVNAVGKILTTIKMEIEYAKANGKVPNLPFIELLPPKIPTKKAA